MSFFSSTSLITMECFVLLLTLSVTNFIVVAKVWKRILGNLGVCLNRILTNECNFWYVFSITLVRTQFRNFSVLNENHPDNISANFKNQSKAPWRRSSLTPKHPHCRHFTVLVFYWRLQHSKRVTEIAATFPVQLRSQRAGTYKGIPTYAQ